MRIMVEQLPDTIEECVFAEYDFEIGHTVCQLTRGEICDIALGNRCGKLKPFDRYIDVLNVLFERINKLENALEEKR